MTILTVFIKTAKTAISVKTTISQSNLRCRKFASGQGGVGGTPPTKHASRPLAGIAAARGKEKYHSTANRASGPSIAENAP